MDQYILEQFPLKGKLLAASAGSDGKVGSYIRKHRGQRYYGYYDHTKKEYIEKKINSR